jgi:glycosyltransferase involved in cell wall biosynthesis
MKILVVVALVSPSGEYGGPTRVAVNQAVELQNLGHDVTIVAGARGYEGDPPTELDGVPAALFEAKQALPRTGFAGLSAPGLRRALPQLAASVDVMHIHLARDLLTLPVAAWARRHGVPYVLQTHGMVAPTKNPLALPLDALLTRRVLRGARRVFYLTPREHDELIEVAGERMLLSQLGNGVPIPAEPRITPAVTELLYLARLAARKRPELFVELACELAKEFPQAVFRLVGPDEGAGPEVQRRIAEAGPGVNIRWEGSIAPDAVPARMARASVYVLPAVDEPYPMSVLEAMAMAIPVVVTDSCGLAPLVRESGCGVVVGRELAELVDGVRGLLDDPERAAECGRRGRRTAQERLGMPAVARRLEEAYAA